MRLNAIVTHEPPWYVARCVEVDVVSQGETAEQAKENLRAALAVSAPIVDPPRERPVLTDVDVPANAVGAPAMAAEGIDRRAFERGARLRGWRAERHGDSEAFRDGGRLVWLPLGFEQVAPGVFRMLDLPSKRGEAAEALERMDALFARHPHQDDTTRVIREQRDAG